MTVIRACAGRIGLALAVLAATTSMAGAGPVVIHGVVRRADNRAPIRGAAVEIKLRAATGTPALRSAVTDGDGAFRVEAPLEGRTFLCEASAPGMSPQRVRRPVGAPTCDFELESQLTVTNATPQSAVVGRGPGLGFFAHTDSALLLKKLTIRLHLTKPLSCGSPGETQQYDLDGTMDVDFGRLSTTIKAGLVAYQMTGEAPLRACDETEVALHVLPARPLQQGDTHIVVTLPSKLSLRNSATRRTIALSEAGFQPTYRSTIDRVTVELVTSRDALASVVLPDLAIPVAVGP